MSRCETCTEKCPQLELADECAKGRMYATKELIECQKELQAFKDKQEQGLLIELPCKVGDTIYKIPSNVNYDLNIINRHPELNRVYEQIVHSIEMYRNDSYLLNTCEGMSSVHSDFYKETWFLTRSEAEEALAKMGE